MPRHLLRVEAVNLGSIIGDTDDLSTRRGGGLLALFAVQQLKDQLPTLNLTPVATGASVGLFEFDGDPEPVEKAVREHFRDHTLEYPLDASGQIGHLPLKHATFAVDVRPASGSSDEDVQRLMAANRWRQLSEPSVSLAGLWGATAKDPCQFDCVRPADTEVHLPERETVLGSASVAARRKYGRGQRQQFYQDVCGAACEFTDEFAQIADRTGLNEKAAPTNTADKLAVFYVDGNGFGGIGREELGKPDGLTAFRDWSKGVQDHHRELLNGLLARTEKDETWWGVNNERKRAVRLETLLWGGDEIVWVVPAWKGWEVAEHFFAHPHRIGHRDVTYSAGLVFCHVKAPIKNVVTLAKERLAESAKKVGGNRLAYEVLESFDDISGDLLEHREKWLPARLKAPKPRPDRWLDPLTIDPAKLKGLIPLLKTIAGSDDFPTRQLYRLCKLWRTPEPTEQKAKEVYDHDTAAALKRLRGCEDAGRAFVGCEAVLGPTAWLHVLNMLPYVPEVPR